MMFYVCECGTIGVWEDERQPEPQAWAQNMEALKKLGRSVAFLKVNTPGGESGGSNDGLWTV